MNDKKLLEIFGLNLKFERIKNKMSQEELAGLVGVSKPYISNIECAKHSISLVNAYKLAKALDVSIEKLLECRD